VHIAGGGHAGTVHIAGGGHAGRVHMRGMGMRAQCICGGWA
jgi:hypothetical protein